MMVDMEPTDRASGAGGRRSRVRRLVWVYAGAVAVVCAGGVAVAVDTQDPAMAKTTASWAVILVAYVAVGALLVSRQPGPLGWLMLVPGLTGLSGVTERWLEHAPEQVTVGVYVAIWTSNLGWLLVFFPVILLLALFPTGRPLSRRWRWHTWVVAGMATTLVLLATFDRRIGPLEGDWMVDNPIGFLPGADDLAWFMPVWTAGLLLITAGALASVVVRYRRADVLERQQLKLLSFAFGVFAVIYLLAVVTNDRLPTVVIDVGFTLGLLVVPVAIAVAILRYRLFDIDLVIRRTIVYAIVAVLLAATYAASVVAFQALLRDVAGVDSSVGVAAATLLVAALFDPVRRRVGRAVARRFFRSHADRAAVASAFGARIRDRTEVAEVVDLLRAAVHTSVAPASFGMWTVRAPPGPDGRIVAPLRSASVGVTEGDGGRDREQGGPAALPPGGA
jgi:hypothetical protein